MSALANALRPQHLDQVIGQSHLLQPGGWLYQLYQKKSIHSLILWGPPGVGKTTLAQILAKNSLRPFHQLSAVSAGKAEIKQIIATAAADQLAPVLFLDEIHRFSKSQQDFLLPFVESGELVLIGATTENPSFEVIPALLSRTRVLILKQLAESELELLIHRAAGYLNTAVPPKSVTEILIATANGDGRKLINLLETMHELHGDFSTASLESAVVSLQLRYDRQGEEHYDTISAFIKSMRASDTDGALYYLARMIAAGEDPVFIARRMIIFASEDVGLAQPTALVVANAVFEAVTKIGYPEAQINLAHGTCYLAQAKKNRQAYDAYFAALGDVQKYGNLPIPLALRNAPTKLMKEVGYGRGYEMYPKISELPRLPEKLSRHRYWSAAAKVATTSTTSLPSAAGTKLTTADSHHTKTAEETSATEN